MDYSIVAHDFVITEMVSHRGVPTRWEWAILGRRHHWAMTYEEALNSLQKIRKFATTNNFPDDAAEWAARIMPRAESQTLLPSRKYPRHVSTISIGIDDEQFTYAKVERD